MQAPVPGLYEYILQHSIQQQPGLQALEALHKARLCAWLIASHIVPRHVTDQADIGSSM